MPEARSTPPYWLLLSGRPLSSTSTPPDLPEPRIEMREPTPVLCLTSTPAMLVNASSTLRMLRRSISLRPTASTMAGLFRANSLSRSAVTTTVSSSVVPAGAEWPWAARAG